MSPLPHPNCTVVSVQSLITEAVSAKLSVASQVLSDDEMLVYAEALEQTEAILFEVLAKLFNCRVSTVMH